MNGKAWTATPFLVGLLLLVMSVSCATAVVDKKVDNPCTPKPLDASNSNKIHEMSPGATLLPDPPDPSLFKPDPCNRDRYNAEEELKVYSGKKMIDRPRPPIEWGLRLYDYAAYTPRPTCLGA